MFRILKKQLKKLLKKEKPLSNLKEEHLTSPLNSLMSPFNRDNPVFYVEFCMDAGPDQVSKTAETILKNFCEHYSKSLGKTLIIEPSFVTRGYPKSRAGMRLPLCLSADFINYVVYSYKFNISKAIAERFEMPSGKLGYGPGTTSVLSFVVDLGLNEKDNEVSKPQVVNLNNLGA